MPNTNLFEEFPIKVLGGGYSLKQRWALTPPSHWRQAQGWRGRFGQLITMEGYLSYIPVVLSPEYQDFFVGGGVAGLGFFGAAYIATCQCIDPTPLLTVPSAWQFKLLQDPDASWQNISSILAAWSSGTIVFQLANPYRGTQPSPAGNYPVGQFPRFILRRAAPQAGNADIETCPVQAIQRLLVAPSNEVLFYLSTRDVYQQGGNPTVQTRVTQSWTTGTISSLTGGGVTVNGSNTSWNISGLVLAASAFNATTGIFTMASVTGIAVGMSISGTGVPPGTIVGAIGGGGITAINPGDINFPGDCTWTVGAPNLSFSALSIIRAQMLFKLNADPETAWTRISAVSNDHTLTLLEPYKGNQAGSGAYTILFNYAAGAISLHTGRTQPWSTTEWLDGAPSTLLIATNGFDPPLKLDGTNPAKPLGGLNPFSDSSLILNTARVVTSYDGRVQLGGLVLNGLPFQRSILWSDLNQAEVFETANRAQLEGDDQIQATAALAGVNVWFTDRGIHNQTPIGAPFFYNFTRKVQGIGTSAPGSVQVKRNQEIIFMGPDDFYVYDLVRENRIGREIRDGVFPNLNDSMIGMTVSATMEDLNLYVCSFPVQAQGDSWNWRTVAFDFVENLWEEPWDGFMAHGQFFQQTELPINSFTQPINFYSNVPIDSRIGPGSLIHLAGGMAGGVLQLFQGFGSDGSVAPNLLVTGMTNCGFDGLKRFGWLMLNADANVPGVQVQVTAWYSMNGEQYIAGPTQLLTLNEGDLSQRDMIVPLNKTAKYIALAFMAPFANQKVILDTVSIFYRKRGRR